MTRRISLSVNNAPIDLDYFVQGFIDHTVVGMVSGLEGVGEPNEITIEINGEDVGINVNSNPVPLNEFVVSMVINTLRGMVSSLKGGEKAEKIQIGIQR